MYKFPELIKKIRTEAGLTQADFASSIGVSSVLIAMVESGQKEVSKKLLQKIANGLDVNPATITPFLYGYEPKNNESLSIVEKQFLAWGQKLQLHLIKNKSKLLIKNAK